jgi:pimeloyl-ACP methyl ester carboxylesterase
VAVAGVSLRSRLGRREQTDRDRGEAPPMVLVVDDVPPDELARVLDALGVERAHVLGYSMGGRIGLDLAWHAPERLRALIIGGSHPYDVPATPAARRMFDNGLAA